MKKLVKIVTNKYFIVGFAFVIWNVFFDQNDYFTLRQRQKELDNLKNNITYLNTEIAKMSKENEQLQTDPNALEQYARENYRLKQDGEDVYVVEH